MTRVACFALAALMAHVLACDIGASAAERPEPETITIVGHTYTVVPDEEFRALGFEFPDVARDENAATYYLEAIGAYVPLGPRPRDYDLRDAVIADRWTDDSGPLAAYVERNAPVFELIEQAAAKPMCHFPVLVDFGESLETVSVNDIRMTYLPSMRELARFVITEGKAREYEGRVAEALDAYVLVLQMGNHVAQGPSIIAGLVGIACNEMGMRAIDQCLVRFDLDEETLARVQERVNVLSGGRPSLVAAMRSERTFSTIAIEHLFRHPDRFGDFGMGNALTRAAFVTMFSSEEGREQVRRDMREFWDAMEKAIEMPLAEFLRSGAGARPIEKARARKVPPNIMGLLGPGLDQTRGAFSRSELYWTVLDVEFALARCALQEGYYPKSLDALKPFMLSDGIDPYSGKPLSYRLEQKGGFTIWSVGENLTDDRGKLDPRRRGRWDQGDYVWNSVAICGAE